MPRNARLCWLLLLLLVLKVLLVPEIEMLDVS